MTRVLALLLIVATSLLFTACSNVQDSSKEEALFVVIETDICDSVIHYFSVEASMGNNLSTGMPKDPNIYEIWPENSDLIDKKFIHVILGTKDGNSIVVLLDDSRPPEIVHTFDFNPSTETE